METFGVNQDEQKQTGTTLHEGMEMPEGAVSCKVKKFIKTVGKVKTTKIIKTFIMEDGTTQTLEEIDEEFVI